MKEESLLLLSDLQKLINQVVLIDYTIIILEGVCMVKCRDILRMKLDGMWLLAGEGGLDRVVSWF